MIEMWEPKLLYRLTLIKRQLMAGNNKDDVIAEINLLQQDIREELSHKQDDKDYYANRHQNIMSMSGSFDKVQQVSPLSRPLDPPGYIHGDVDFRGPPLIFQLNIDPRATHGSKDEKGNPVDGVPFLIDECPYVQPAPQLWVSSLKIAKSHQGDKPCKTFGPGDFR